MVPIFSGVVKSFDTQIDFGSASYELNRFSDVIAVIPGRTIEWK